MSLCATAQDAHEVPTPRYLNTQENIVCALYNIVWRK